MSSERKRASSSYNKNSVLTRHFPEGSKGYGPLQRYRLLVIQDLLGTYEDSHERLERFEQRYRRRIEARQAPNGAYIGNSVGRYVYDELQSFSREELERIAETLDRRRRSTRQYLVTKKAS